MADETLIDKIRSLPRSLFRELMSGVKAMREHRKGRLTLRTHQVEPITLPILKPEVVRETREALQMSRKVRSWVDVLKTCPVPMDDLPPRSREYPRKRKL